MKHLVSQLSQEAREILLEELRARAALIHAFTEGAQQAAPVVLAEAVKSVFAGFSFAIEEANTLTMTRAVQARRMPQDAPKPEDAPKAPEAPAAPEAPMQPPPGFADYIDAKGQAHRIKLDPRDSRILVVAKLDEAKPQAEKVIATLTQELKLRLWPAKGGYSGRVNADGLMILSSLASEGVSLSWNQ